jgi:hypothetical protein
MSMYASRSSWPRRTYCNPYCKWSRALRWGCKRMAYYLSHSKAHRSRNKWSGGHFDCPRSRPSSVRQLRNSRNKVRLACREGYRHTLHGSTDQCHFATIGKEWGLRWTCTLFHRGLFRYRRPGLRSGFLRKRHSRHRRPGGDTCQSLD